MKIRPSTILLNGPEMNVDSYRPNITIVKRFIAKVRLEHHGGDKHTSLLFKFAKLGSKILTKGPEI